MNAALPPELARPALPHIPAMPHHLRLTIGKKSEMEAFLAAFGQVKKENAT